MHQREAKPETAVPGASVSIDPVCGMIVTPNAAAGSHEYNGQTYYFCSTHCLKKFSEDPERFLNKPTEPMTSQPIGIGHDTKPAATPAAATYTCPMHPEVRQDKSGSCPKCGGNCRGGMSAFRAADGEPQWNLSLKGCIRSIGSSGNMLFAGVQEGTIYAYALSAKP